MKPIKGAASPSVRPKSKPDSEQPSTPTDEEIRLRAFEIYTERGALPGADLDHWLEAERELLRAHRHRRRSTG